MLTGKTTPGYANEINLAGSGVVDLISRQRSVET